MTFFDLLQYGALFDSHCHLNSFESKLIKEIIHELKESRVKYVCDIATNLDSSKKSLKLSKLFDGIVFASMGIDPEIFIPQSSLFLKRVFNLKEIEKWLDNKRLEMERMLNLSKNFVLIGETGIDSYWLVKNGYSRDIVEKSIELQKRLFRLHIDLGLEYELPLTIHSRNSINICLEELFERKVPKNFAVFHSLTPDLDDDEKSFYLKVSKILEAGFFIGINGIITYKSAYVLRNVVKKTIEERLGGKILSLKDFYEIGFLLETDSPYLAPIGKRGEVNSPVNIETIFDFIKDL